MAKLIVLPFRHGPFWNFSYLIACAETGAASVVDPAWDALAILRAATAHGLEIQVVVLTHTHSDHINGLAEVVAETGASVVVHESEAAVIAPEFADYLIPVTGEASFELGSSRLSVLHTPGHSPGSIAIVGAGHLFSGDTLHVGGVGRPGPQPEALAALWESVGRLRELPAETVLHPGHDEGRVPVSTLGEERGRGGALMAETFAEFVRELERSTGRRFEGH